jgi:hypothetical protein
MKEVDIMKFREYIGQDTAERGTRSSRSAGKTQATVPDADSLRDAFRLAVCAYVDYWEYACTLGYLLECYDESHEEHDTESWLSVSIDSGMRFDNLIIEGYETLDSAEIVLSRIADRAEQRCRKLLRAVLTSPARVQRKILGRSIRISEIDVNAFIESFFDIISDYDFPGDADENYDIFVGALLGELGEL